MIRFSEYFNSWLYGKDGYYTNYKNIGKEGDFFTSVSVTPFFGGAIAKKIISSIESGFLNKTTTILEIGAEKGYLIADIIQFIYTLKPELLETLNFAILEKYENLREIQKKYLFDSFGSFIKFQHYDDLENIKLDNAFIISNEIFDSFSCDLVFTKDNILNQVFVDNHEIKFLPCKNNKVLEHCKKYSIEKGEISLEYLEFVTKLCKNINKFEFIAFDYGEKNIRNDFSLRIYKGHKVYPFFEKNLELKSFYKNSDITYDVHFGYLIDCFKQNNIHNIELKTQLKTLIDFGILDLLEILKANVDEKSYQKELQKVKILLQPNQLAERFKCLSIRK